MRANPTLTWTIVLFSSLLAVYIALNVWYSLFSLPYFWDELGVYSRAAIHMYEHGIGFLPKALPDELSRGHPLLIPFVFAISFKIFGCTVTVAKITAACIYSLGIYYLYRIFLFRFSARASCLFALLIAIQPCFLAQSVLVLPEGPLMVSCVAALYYFLRGKYTAVSIALCTALFIKESAIILPFIFYFVDLLINRFKLRPLLYLLLAPFTCIILFFYIQYLQRGYVFFPLHTELMKFDEYYINERYHEFSEFIYFGQGRQYLWFYLPVVFIIYKVVRQYPNVSIQFNIDTKRFDSRLYLTIILIFLAGLSFSIVNYFLSRYTLYFLVLFYVAFICICFQVKKWNLLNCVAIAVLIYNAIAYNHTNHYTDVNFSYVDHIKSCQKAVNYLNTPAFQDKKVAFDFPIGVATWNPLSGYFKHRYFESSGFDDSANMNSDYYVFTYPGNIDNLKLYRSHLDSVTTLSWGYANVCIYKNHDKK